MKELLEFIVKGILGKEGFSVDELEGGTNLSIKVDPSLVGLIIGKGGKVIKAIRNVMRVRATLEKKVVFVNVEAEGLAPKD